MNETIWYACDLQNKLELLIAYKLCQQSGLLYDNFYNIDSLYYGFNEYKSVSVLFSYRSPSDRGMFYFTADNPEEYEDKISFSHFLYILGFNNV